MRHNLARCPRSRRLNHLVPPQPKHPPLINHLASQNLSLPLPLRHSALPFIVFRSTESYLARTLGAAPCVVQGAGFSFLSAPLCSSSELSVFIPRQPLPRLLAKVPSSGFLFSLFHSSLPTLYLKFPTNAHPNHHRRRRKAR